MLQGLGLVILSICIVGAVGGLINALVTGNGSIARPEIDPENKTILRLGVIANVVIGAFAAFISWALYGPLSTTLITLPRPPEAAPIQLAVSSIGTAGLIGFAGARWLTAEVERTVLKTATSEALTKAANPQAAAQVQLATPSQALHIVRSH